MKLKPCPFCGGEARQYEDSFINVRWVECIECETESREYESDEEAIKVWNRREPMDEIVEQLEAEAERWHESGREFGDEKELGVADGFRYAIEIVKKGGAV